MRKPFVVLYRIADVTDGLTAASSAGLSAVERNVSLTASSLLTLGNARIRFGIALAYSQPSTKIRRSGRTCSKLICTTSSRRAR